MIATLMSSLRKPSGVNDDGRVSLGGGGEEEGQDPRGCPVVGLARREEEEPLEALRDKERD